MSIGKTQLIEEIARQNGDLSKTQIKAVVESFIETTIKAVKKGDKVSLIGFGTFSRRSRGARTGRNPKTGDPVKIKASQSISFKMSSALKGDL